MDDYSSDSENDDNSMSIENNSSRDDNEELESVNVEASASTSTTENNPIRKKSQKLKLHKKRKHGVIYLSTIPKYMNVTILRDMLSVYGKVGRIFLQPAATVQSGNLDDSSVQKKKGKGRQRLRQFTEGWIEFQSKNVAKQVVIRLNNQSMASRKSSKFYGILWNMKYLSGFKWVHLSERLTYEKAVHRQRLQNEVSQARKEATFFQANLDRSEMLKKQMKKKIKQKV